MREDMLFQERCFTLRVNGEPAEQILCSEGNWRELSVGYLLSQGRVKSSDDILSVEEEEDRVAVRLKGALRPACFLTDRLFALPPFAVKADVDDDLIRSLGRALQEGVPFGRHRAVIRRGGDTAVFDDAGRHNALDKAIGYAALAWGYWPQLCRFRLVGAIACVGRMALTNYLLQTLICTTLFYHLGLFMRFDRLQLLAFVPPIWAVNLLVSSLWLRRFRQGPVEWLWRQLTLRASGTSLKDTSR